MSQLKLTQVSLRPKGRERTDLRNPSYQAYFTDVAYLTDREDLTHLEDLADLTDCAICKQAHSISVGVIAVGKAALTRSRA